MLLRKNGKWFSRNRNKKLNVINTNNQSMFVLYSQRVACSWLALTCKAKKNNELKARAHYDLYHKPLSLVNQISQKCTNTSPLMWLSLTCLPLVRSHWAQRNSPAFCLDIKTEDGLSHSPGQTGLLGYSNFGSTPPSQSLYGYSHAHGRSETLHIYWI